MKEYLTDLEIAKIEAFCADNDMKEAVKKVILQHIYSQGVLQKGEAHNPLKNRAFMLVQHATEGIVSDEQLGQHLRGMWEGVNALEAGFKELATIKTVKNIKKKEVNDAI